MPRPFARLLLVFAVLIALTSLCNFPRAFPPPEPTAFPLTRILTDTPPRPTEPLTTGPCGFVWASQSLPELSEQLLTRLNEAGLPVVTARAEAYGENCLYSDGTLAYFAAMQTDYHITLAVEILTDTETLGSLLEQTLEIIAGFPVGETPGPNPGYIGITFQAGELVENLWFKQTQSDALRAQGLSGEQLYEALR